MWVCDAWPHESRTKKLYIFCSSSSFSLDARGIQQCIQARGNVICFAGIFLQVYIMFGDGDGGRSVVNLPNEKCNLCVCNKLCTIFFIANEGDPRALPWNQAMLKLPNKKHWNKNEKKKKTKVMFRNSTESHWAESVIIFVALLYKEIVCKTGTTHLWLTVNIHFNGLLCLRTP